MSSRVNKEVVESDHIMKRQGTPSVVDLANHVGSFPTKYFEKGTFENHKKINGDAVEKKKDKKETCWLCRFACKPYTKDEETGLETGGPEYETLMSFGANVLIDDIVSVMESNDRCDNLGLDTISAGDTIAGYLKAEDEFGNSELVHELIGKIAHREENGDLLAEGIDRIHEDLGVRNFTVKGLEFPGHDGRTLNGMGLGFSTSNRGADHLYSMFYAYEYPLVSMGQAIDPQGLDGKAEKLVELENARAFEDCAIICRFCRYFMNENRYKQLLDAEYEDLLKVGSKIVDLERHFNNQRGFDREDDKLPYSIEGFQEALDKYYNLRGWNSDGTVPQDRIDDIF